MRLGTGLVLWVGLRVGEGLKGAVGNFCKNIFYTYLLNLSLCPDSRI